MIVAWFAPWQLTVLAGWDAATALLDVLRLGLALAAQLLNGLASASSLFVISASGVRSPIAIASPA